MAQIIELPNGSFYDNGAAFEDQSAPAQTWVTDNFAVWSQTYMFLSANYISMTVGLVAPYTGDWQNRRNYTDQSNSDAKLWYDDAAPVFYSIMIYSTSSQTVDVMRAGGIYDLLLPISAQTINVQRYVAQSIDEARRLKIYGVDEPDEVLLPNAAVWDNSKTYAAQTVGAQTESDLLWSGGVISGNAIVVDGTSYANQKDNATWRLKIPNNGSNDYFIKTI